MKSYAVEVIADNSGEFVGNAIRLATEVEAVAYGRDLAGRWMLVREWRVVESEDEPNYRWEGKLIAIGGKS